MTTLPSFVDLVSSLGLKQEQRLTLSLPASSPSSRSVSPESPSLAARDHATLPLKAPSPHKKGNRRYSPYSSALPYRRRGSISSTPTPEPEQSDPRHRRRSRGSLDFDGLTHPFTFNPSDSTSDLDANAPISSYVRKKRSGGPLISSTYSYEEWNGVAGILLPCIPVMPSLLPGDSYIERNNTAAQPDGASSILTPRHPPVSTSNTASDRPRQRTGLRLSMPF